MACVHLQNRKSLHLHTSQKSTTSSTFHEGVPLPTFWRMTSPIFNEEMKVVCKEVLEKGQRNSEDWRELPGHSSNGSKSFCHATGKIFESGRINTIWNLTHTTKEWRPAGHDPRVKIFLLTRNPRVMGVRVAGQTDISFNVTVLAEIDHNFGTTGPIWTIFVSNYPYSRVLSWFEGFSNQENWLQRQYSQN